MLFVLKESALQLLADLGSLTDAAAQVIQLGAANITAAHGLDLLDEGEWMGNTFSTPTP